MFKNLQFLLFTKAVQLSKKRQYIITVEILSILNIYNNEVASLDNSTEVERFQFVPINVSKQSSDFMLLGNAFQSFPPLNAKLFL